MIINEVYYSLLLISISLNLRVPNFVSGYILTCLLYSSWFYYNSLCIWLIHVSYSQNIQCNKLDTFIRNKQLIQIKYRRFTAVTFRSKNCGYQFRDISLLFLIKWGNDKHIQRCGPLFSLLNHTLTIDLNYNVANCIHL